MEYKSTQETMELVDRIIAGCKNELAGQCCFTVLFARDGQDAQICGSRASTFCRNQECGMELCLGHADHFMGEIYCLACGHDEREREAKSLIRRGYYDIGKSVELEARQYVHPRLDTKLGWSREDHDLEAESDLERDRR